MLTLTPGSTHSKYVCIKDSACRGGEKGTSGGLNKGAGGKGCGENRG